MAEPPYKRARRPDSKQMWDESDRRAPIASRERDEPRENRRGDRRDDRGGRDRDGRDGDRGGRDRDRERDRRYRSRSPRGGRDSRGGRDRDRGGRWDDADARDSRGNRGDGRDDRGGRRREEERNDATRGGSHRESGRDTRDKPRERSRSRDRRRSRSPRRERDDRRDMGKEREKEREVEKPALQPTEEEYTKSKTATAPVSFKVGRATSHEAQDHDRMETDDETKPLKIKGAKKKARTPEPEEDPEIIIEDDGMAAMQAMMGFGGFSTTQNKKVAGNDVSAVRKEKKTEYRQYMNRVGGFNRPLSPSHD